MKSPRSQAAFCIRSTQTRLLKIGKKKPQGRKLAPPNDSALECGVRARPSLRRNPGNRSNKDSERINQVVRFLCAHPQHSTGRPLDSALSLPHSLQGDFHVLIASQAWELLSPLDQQDAVGRKQIVKA